MLSKPLYMLWKTLSSGYKRYFHDHLRMSLYQCWAERGSGATSEDRFEIWNQFCPKYQFVAPQVVEDTNDWLSNQSLGKEYLNVTWDRKTPIHSLNFRFLSKWFI